MGVLIRTDMLLEEFKAILPCNQMCYANMEWILREGRFRNWDCIRLDAFATYPEDTDLGLSLLLRYE